MAKEAFLTGTRDLAQYFRPLKNRDIWLQNSESKFKGNKKVEDSITAARHWIHDLKHNTKPPRLEPEAKDFFGFITSVSILESVRVAQFKEKPLDKSHVGRFNRLEHYVDRTVHSFLLTAIIDPSKLESIEKQVYNFYGVATDVQNMQSNRELFLSQAKPSKQ